MPIVASFTQLIVQCPHFKRCFDVNGVLLQVGLLLIAQHQVNKASVPSFAGYSFLEERQFMAANAKDSKEIIPKRLCFNIFR